MFGSITFAFDNLYPTYEMAPTWFLATQQQDQSLAGAFMKVSGLFSFGIPFIVLFFRWYEEETGRKMDGTPARRAQRLSEAKP